MKVGDKVELLKGATIEGKFFAVGSIGFIETLESNDLNMTIIINDSICEVSSFEQYFKLLDNWEPKNGEKVIIPSESEFFDVNRTFIGMNKSQYVCVDNNCNFEEYLFVKEIKTFKVAMDSEEYEVSERLYKEIKGSKNEN